MNFREEFEAKDLENVTEGLLVELERGQKRMNSFMSLYKLNREMFVAYRSGADFKNDSVLGHLEGLKEKVYSCKPLLDGSLRLDFEYHSAMSDYYRCKNDSAKSFTEMMSLYEVFQRNPSAKHEYLLRYRLLLSNIVSRAFDIGNNEVFETLLQELKELPVDSFNAEGEVFQNVYFLEHLRFLGRGELEKAETLIPEIVIGLEKFESKINRARLLSFEYNIMVMYFIMHRFSKAKEWAEKILDDKSEIKRNVTTVTRILYPIIHYELGHQDLVENLTRSAYRYLLKLKRLHAFERIMIKYLQTLPLSPDSVEFETKLNLLSEDMFGLRKNPKESLTSGFEEVELWVAYHLEGTEMNEKLRQMVG